MHKGVFLFMLLACWSAPAAYSQRKLTKASSPQAQDSTEIVGTWKWFNGATVLASPDGGLRSFWNNGNQGSGRYERLPNGRYRLVWGSDSWVDVLELKSGGNFLEGVNQKGTKVTATKISTRIDEEMKGLPPYSLSGVWVNKDSPDGARFYLNQVGKTVYWFGESESDNPVWAHVVYGTLKEGKLLASYSDIPKGKNRFVGELKFEIVKPDELYLYDSSGGWPSKITYVKAEAKTSSGEKVIRRRVIPVAPNQKSDRELDSAKTRIEILEDPFTQPDRQKRYIRFYNCAVGEAKLLDTFNENNGKGLCRLFLGDDGDYSGQFWDLRRPGSLSNQFLGPAREIALNEKGEWVMGVQGMSADQVTFIPDPDRKAFKITLGGKYLSADLETKYPGSSHFKVYSSEKDLGEKSSWKAYVSDRALAE